MERGFNTGASDTVIMLSWRVGRNRIICTFFIYLYTVLLVACNNQQQVPVYSAGYSVRDAGLTHYKVRRDDTLLSIAWQFQRDYQSLAEINGIAKPYLIYPGQVLLLKKRRQLETKNNNHNVERYRKNQYDKLSSKKQKRVKKEFTYQVTHAQKNTSLHWFWPAKGSVSSSYSSSGIGRNGLDITGKYGAPIRAAASGKVVYSGGGLIGYGNLIIIEHNVEFLSAYAHNSKLFSKENDVVEAGQIIAEMGASGTSLTKLHFEIRRNGVPIDPVKYLPKRK